MNQRLLLLFLALLVVAAVRLYGLAGAALPDYDSVYNWQIVREVAAGDLTHLFHQGAPLFYLIIAPLVWLGGNFHFLQHANALLSVVAVGSLATFVGREARLSAWQTAGLALFIGTSVFLTFSGRDFTMNSGNLLVFAGLLRAYYHRLQVPSRQTLLRAAVWLMLGIGFNYRFLFTVPILVAFELLAADDLLLRRGNAWRVIAILVAPFVVLGLVSLVAGLPLQRQWLAVYYGLIMRGEPNLAGNVGIFHLDLLYYFYFLRDFESPLVLLTLLVAPVLWRRELFQRQQLPNLARYLAVWGYCFLAGMSLLIKAPRGLLLAYGVFYALTFLSLRRLVSGKVLGVLVLLAVGFNVYRIEREVYSYAPTNYPKVAEWLRNQRVAKLLSTIGQGAAPFVASMPVVVITDEKQLPALRQQSYRYVLLDAYWRVAGVQRFEALRRQPAVAAWPELQLTSPLLFLEHSEYTGLTYHQTLARQQAAARDSLQLRLIRLE
ncbi:hypothetical protein [Hymenobacter roseosalivarius]|uniref:hypothetical protein n=1 Tax=Hymenobacter roseosalivarius TaxID=89967 RepID=UPI0009FBCDF8|nr:hypothetical protein [Hymenobacter roseosalivarius]